MERCVDVLSWQQELISKKSVKMFPRVIPQIFVACEAEKRHKGFFEEVVSQNYWLCKALASACFDSVCEAYLFQGSDVDAMYVLVVMNDDRLLLWRRG